MRGLWYVWWHAPAEDDRKWAVGLARTDAELALAKEATPDVPALFFLSELKIETTVRMRVTPKGRGVAEAEGELVFFDHHSDWGIIR